MGIFSSKYSVSYTLVICVCFCMYVILQLKIKQNKTEKVQQVENLVCVWGGGWGGRKNGRLGLDGSRTQVMSSGLDFSLLLASVSFHVLASSPGSTCG